MTVCVFAASSSKVDNEYGKDTARLGSLLAGAGFNVVFGGGGIGLMNSLADAVISNNGRITGVIPAFMKEEGWSHDGISETIVTSDMSERKQKMFSLSDAIVALPGGMGTLRVGNMVAATLGKTAVITGVTTTGTSVSSVLIPIGLTGIIIPLLVGDSTTTTGGRTPGSPVTPI